MSEFEFVRPTRAGDELPPEYRQAYSEMCTQFMVAAVQAYQDRSRLTIMRDLPVQLQMNAFLVGSVIGALTPTMAALGPRADAEITKALTAQVPKIVAEARKRADEIMRVG